MKEAGVYGGLKSSPAVTLSHDAGQRLKSMGQVGGLVCTYYVAKTHIPTISLSVF